MAEDSSDRWTAGVGDPDKETFSQQSTLHISPAADKHGG
jgi:hypothetical protein